MKKIKWPENLPLVGINKKAIAVENGTDAIYTLELLLDAEQILSFYQFCDRVTYGKRIKGDFDLVGYPARVLSYFYEPVRATDGSVMFKAILRYSYRKVN